MGRREHPVWSRRLRIVSRRISGRRRVETGRKPRPLEAGLGRVPASSGDRSWGQVWGFSGTFRAHRGRGSADNESTSVAGKCCKQALFLGLRRAMRILHGKEGVDGSSPSEAYLKCLQIGICCCLGFKHADPFRTHLRYARRPATSCDPFGHNSRKCHRGKEGVDGSSLSEGFEDSPAQRPLPLSPLASLGVFRVHPASTA